MDRNGLKRIANSQELTSGEKKYIIDCQFHVGRRFILALYEAIARADETDLQKLLEVFPEEVQGYIAWTRGDLAERASRIGGVDCTYVIDKAASVRNVR